MILIPDIHISAKQSIAIIHRLKEIFSIHKDKEVMFLGDYIYMFSYDRAALMDLFWIFIDLYREGRTIKVLSWNHDRIGGHFVFEEGKQAFELLSNTDQSDGSWSLEFITQPNHRIDKNNNLHICIPFNDKLYKPAESNIYSSSSLIWSPELAILSCIEQLKSSEKPWEQFSGLLNEILLTYSETNKNKFNQIIIYHHYYIAQQAFPGVKSKFAFQDKAISPLFLDINHINLVSGHIHESFSYKNYLCCGSFRHTSASEVNEAKYFFCGESSAYKAYMHRINPKFVVNRSSDLQDENSYIEMINQIITDSSYQLQWKQINEVVIKSPEAKDCDIIFSYHESSPSTDVISQNLKQAFHSTQFQKKQIIWASMEESSLLEANFSLWIQSWKDLLSWFLDSKYPDLKIWLVDFMNKNKIL